MIVIFGNFVEAVGPFESVEAVERFVAKHEEMSGMYDPEPRFAKYRRYSVTEMRLTPPES